MTPHAARVLSCHAASLLLLLAAACAPPIPSGAGAKPTPPAIVAAPLTDDALGTVTLTAEAERRLGIAVVLAESRSVTLTRLYGGVTAPTPDGRATMRSPWPGAVSTPPKVGVAVAKGASLLTLTPDLPPDRESPGPADRAKLAEARNALDRLRLDAETDVRAATIARDAADVAAKRARALLAERSAPQRAVDEADAVLRAAASALEAATARREIVGRMTLDGATGAPTPIPLVAPIAGVIVEALAAPQRVAAGETLFVIESPAPLLVRVSVPIGDLADLSVASDASLAALDGGPALETPLKPFDAPRPDDARSVAATLLYLAPNADGALRPGRRVGVRISRAASGPALVTPRGAVVHDVHGGAHVFVKKGDRAFASRRVDVREIVGDVAVVVRGLAAGDPVVTTGAAELWGAAYGFGK